MISKFAIDEIETLQEQGYRLTPRDIIRLNALALKVTEARGKDVTKSEFLLHRVAVLAPGVTLRQPCVGHEIWIESVFRWIDRDDYQTILAVNCFALSRPPDALPDPDDPAVVKSAVEEYAAKMSGFSTDQLYVALDYVKNGANHTTGEYYSRRRDGDDDTTEDLGIDWDECVAVGVLREGAAVLWGLSLAEMKKMTRTELQEAISRAYWFHGKDHCMDSAEKKALGDFYAAKNEITERLTREKEHDNGPAAAV